VAGDIITLFDGATSVGSATVDANGNWSITTATLPEGLNLITATQSDVFGNASAPSSALNITVDTIAPAVTARLVSDSGVSATDNITRSAALTGAGDANGIVTIRNGTTVLGSTTAGATGTWNFALLGLTDGTYSLTASESDLAGNTGATTLGFTLDTAAPAAPSTPDLLAASDSGASSTDNVTNIAAPTFSGTAEANTTVTLFDGATVAGSGVASATGAWAVTTGTLAGAVHAITARATDLAGNVSAASAALSVTIDSSAPTAPSAPDLLAASDSGTSSTDNVTNVAAPTFSGTAEANAAVTLFDGAAVVGSGVAGATGAWSVTSAGLADGVHTITAKATDLAGNVSAASAALSVTIDTSAPAAPGTPDLAAVSDSGTSNADNVTNVTTPVFTGSAEANASVTVFDGATAVGTGLANAAGLWSVTTSPLANGVHAISAKATDIAGNVSTVSAALAVTIDTSAPAAPGTPDLVATSDSGASSTDNVTNVTTPVLSGTAEANATVTLFDGTTVVGTAVADATGAWSLTASTLAGGLHAISAKATDAAGNIGAASATLAVTIDTTAPAAPSTPDLLAASDSGASGTDNVTNVTTPVFAGTAEANATVTLFDGATVVGTAVADATGAWSVTTSALAGGVHAISAKATDLAGNAGATSAALSVTIDTAAPLAPSTPDLLAASDSGASSTDNVTNVTTPVFTGTAEANSTITLFDGATVVGSGLANGTGLWSVATGVLTNGVHSLSAKATDLAGNLSTASAALLVTIDATAPAAPSTPDLSAASDSGASTTDNVTNIVTPAFTGTAEANATVTVFDGTTVVGTTLANAAGAWSVTAGALAAGVHLITATATDVAGNASAASAALAVTIDTTAPVAPATPDLLAASDSGASNTDNLTNVTTPAFSGTAEANSTVTLLDGATVVGSGLADATGAWSVTASPLADGVHAISAKATDLAGNASVASAALAVTIDITPPVAPAIAKVTTAAISGAAEANSAITLFDGALQIGTGSANAAGTWSIPLALTSGTHTLIAKATDLAGNATASVALTAIIGTAADDLLSGGPGVITMLGTAGNDTYIVDNSLDVVTENAGEGSDTVLAGTSYTLAAGSEIEFLRANTTAGLTLTGNEFANTITGNAGNDTLIGGGGDDTFVATAGDGNDIYNGGTGIDTYDLSQTLAAATVSLAAGTATSLQTGTDTLIAIENVIGGGGNDLIVGSAVANILSGGAGDDNLKASGGDDTLFGGAGNDVLDGGTGADTMSGGTGDDIYLVDNVGDIVVEAFGEGNDTVNTTLNSYTLGANVENLKFTGTGNFIGTGNTLANAINGGAGDDMLDDGGVGGVDKLTGGAGNDTYVVRNTGDLVVEGALSGGIDTVDTTLASYTLGANVENLTFIGTGSFAGNGNALDNTIIGGAGADKLNGGAGNDIMAGGAGDDVYFVDSIGDVVTEQLGEGTDTVNTTLNSYSLAALGNVENLSFTGASAFTGTGNAAANVITGGAGNDTLDGGDGNDTLIGGLGADTMTGGAGDDTYVVDNTGDIVIEAVGGGTDTVTTTLNSYTLTANVENLTFRGIGAFAGTGNALANIITGGAGNDTLDDGGIGGAGDLLTGGAGNDTYIVNNVGDAVIEAVGGGTDTVNTTLSSYTLGLNVENLTFNGTGSFLGIGNAAANILTGGAGADNLKASGGNDTLIGGAGNDVLDGGTGADAMIGGAGDDTYFVDNAGDTVVEALGEGNDTVSTTLNSYTLGANVENLKFTGTGSFTGVGNTLANTIFGGAGDDALDDGGVGGTGDKLTGGAGNDTYVVRNTGDLVVEALNGGTDTVNTTLLSYTLGANVENLTFIGIGGSAGSGNALDNIITGGDGADTLNGGIGNDTMIGGGGNDIMTGGVGNDVFKYLAANFGADVITDFGSAPGTAQDLIDISGLGITAASFATSVTVGGGVNALITLGGGTITLTGVNQNAIDITDFKLA
jgi:Ca2+-binding RTX toxin-like protein